MMSLHSTVFVTGGAGFIGFALVRKLITATPVHVVSVGRPTHAGNLDSLESARGDRHRLARVDAGGAAVVRAPFVGRIVVHGSPAHTAIGHSCR
jgi:dTDP-glucose 4,6-dehydratase